MPLSLNYLAHSTRKDFEHVLQLLLYFIHASLEILY